MATVRLDFVPPAEEGITRLHIYESTVADGPFTEIELVTPVGVYPDYLTAYTTDDAASTENWFAIAWENAQGAVSDLSAPVRGGTELLIGKVIRRVLQRDPTLDENIVSQEAEAAIQSYVGVDDPYDVSADVSYTQLNGLVYLVLARSLISRMVSMQASGGTADQVTIGLLSMKSGSTSATSSVTSTQDAIKALLEMAMTQLGISRSAVLHLAVPETVAPFSSYDHSRLLGWVGLE